MHDPEGKVCVCGDCSMSVSYRESYACRLLRILRDKFPRIFAKSAVRRSVRIVSELEVLRVVDYCTCNYGVSKVSEVSVSVCGDCCVVDSYRDSYTARLSILRDKFPRVFSKSAVRRVVGILSMSVSELVVSHSSVGEWYNGCTVRGICEAGCCKQLLHTVWYREQQSTPLECGMFEMQALEFKKCEQMQRECQKILELLKLSELQLGVSRCVIERSVVHMVAEYSSTILSLFLFSFLSFYPTLHLSFVWVLHA